MQWTVVSCDVAADGSRAQLVMAAHLRQTQLDVRRTFTVLAGEPVVRVDEGLKNLVGFERALGRAQHVTLGAAFLRDRTTTVTANATRGFTHSEGGPHTTLALGAEFEYPSMPAAAGAAAAAAATAGAADEVDARAAAAGAADTAAPGRALAAAANCCS